MFKVPRDKTLFVNVATLEVLCHNMATLIDVETSCLCVIMRLIAFCVVVVEDMVDCSNSFPRMIR